MANINKARIAAQMLYDDIDDCIDKLLKAKLSKDKEDEAIWEMELLMSEAQVRLNYIINHLTGNSNDGEISY